MEHAPFDRVVVIHGFRAAPHKHWFPWLARTVPGAEVVALPDPAAPQADAWVTTAADAIGSLSPRVAVVAHSLGCVTTVQAVRRLAAAGGADAADPQGAALGAFVAVSPFADPLTHTGDEGLDAFAVHGLAPFLVGVDLPSIREHLGEVTVIRSDDDPLVAPHLSDAFATGLDATVRVLPGGKHFLESQGTTELPAVLDALS